MLLVNAELSISPVHGIGLFAKEDIPKGTPIWKYHPRTCQRLEIHEFLELCHELPILAITNFLNYSYVKNNVIFYISDNTRFINHSLEANVVLIDEFTEVASRDIKIGEELLENYQLSYDERDFFNIENLFNIQDREELINYLETKLCSL